MLATVYIFVQNMVLRQTVGSSRLFHFPCLFFIDCYYPTTLSVALGEITCLSETPEQLCELENAARVSIDTAVSRK